MQSKLPSNPLTFIQECVRHKQVLWSYHVNMRMKGRFIHREDILQSYANYEIIEAYPKDKYFPSYLVYSEYDGNMFHILFGVDIERVSVRIITAYRPNPDEWEDDLKTRRHSS